LEAGQVLACKLQSSILGACQEDPAAVQRLDFNLRFNQFGQENRLRCRSLGLLSVRSVTSIENCVLQNAPGHRVQQVEQFASQSGIRAGVKLPPNAWLLQESIHGRKQNAQSVLFRLLWCWLGQNLFGRTGQPAQVGQQLRQMLGAQQVLDHELLQLKKIFAKIKE